MRQDENVDVICQLYFHNMVPPARIVWLKIVMVIRCHNNCGTFHVLHKSNTVLCLVSTKYSPLLLLCSFMQLLRMNMSVHS